ncbi:MAG: hypothetical protein AAF335_03325 [Bacteroidota bacterium]
MISYLKTILTVDSFCQKSSNTSQSINTTNETYNKQTIGNILFNHFKNSYLKYMVDAKYKPLRSERKPLLTKSHIFRNKERIDKLFGFDFKFCNELKNKLKEKKKDNSNKRELPCGDVWNCLSKYAAKNFNKFSGKYKDLLDSYSIQLYHPLSKNIGSSLSSSPQTIVTNSNSEVRSNNSNNNSKNVTIKKEDKDVLKIVSQNNNYNNSNNSYSIQLAPPITNRSSLSNPLQTIVTNSNSEVRSNNSNNNSKNITIKKECLEGVDKIDGKDLLKTLGKKYNSQKKIVLNSIPSHVEDAAKTLINYYGFKHPLTTPVANTHNNNNSHHMRQNSAMIESVSSNQTQNQPQTINLPPPILYNIYNNGPFVNSHTTLQNPMLWPYLPTPFVAPPQGVFPLPSNNNNVPQQPIQNISGGFYQNLGQGGHSNGSNLS